MQPTPRPSLRDVCRMVRAANKPNKTMRHAKTGGKLCSDREAEALRSDQPDDVVARTLAGLRQMEDDRRRDDARCAAILAVGVLAIVLAVIGAVVRGVL